MRYTLEQLKAMSDVQLWEAWRSADFPFDNARPCGCCLTNHNPAFMAVCDEVAHSGLVAEMSKFPFTIGHSLRPFLEEFYALRLFFDHLYPQPAEQQSAAEQVERNEACRCGEAFATYDELLEHIATDKPASGPHISEKAFERMEESFLEFRAGTR